MFSGPRAHFDRHAEVYARSRPEYPEELYERLAAYGVTGPRVRLLEIGAGAGEATRRLARSVAELTAIEPGPDLAARLGVRVPSARILIDTFEAAFAAGLLSEHAFDSVCIATAFHWLDPAVALPGAHHLLRAGGRLAVWRHVFGRDDAPPTPFRERVAAITARRPDSHTVREHHRQQFSWRTQLVQGGWFDLVHEGDFDWSLSLSSSGVQDLFSTFSDWSPAEVRSAARAVDELGGTVVEHYRTSLAILDARTRGASGPTSITPDPRRSRPTIGTT